MSERVNLTLFELADEIHTILQDDSIEDEERWKQIENLPMDLNEKVSNCIKWILNLEASKDAAKQHKQFFEEKMRSISKEIDWMREAITHVMHRLGVHQAGDDFYRASFRKASKPSVRVLNEDDVNPMFVVDNGITVNKALVLDMANNNRKGDKLTEEDAPEGFQFVFKESLYIKSTKKKETTNV